ncbi:molybdenum ABC transporter ATP-binding protein [Sediminimonas qiaohouensis]
MTMLSLDIRLDYPDFTLDFSHDLPARGLTAVFGPSGCGKSTLLRVIAGLERGARGTVRFDGTQWQGTSRTTPPHKRGIGYVFQDARLFGHLSVAGNLRYAARRARRAGAQPDEAQAIAALDLHDLLDRRPDTLSGGQRQRVAIARALLTAPRLLLMDEPLAALDAGRKAAILPYIERLRDHATIPIVYVSHDLSEVARLADHMVMMRAGRVLRAGPVAELLSDPGMADAIGVREMGALMPARVTRHHDDGLTELGVSGGQLFLPRVQAAPGTALRLRIAAHEVILSRTRPTGLSALNILPGTITELRHGDGPGVIVKLRVGDDDLLARITRRSADEMGLHPGIACHAIVKSVSIAQTDVGTTGTQ